MISKCQPCVNKCIYDSSTHARMGLFVEENPYRNPASDESAIYGELRKLKKLSIPANSIK